MMLEALLMNYDPANVPKRPLRAWEIVLIILGSPLWLPLLVAGAAIVISVYAVIWSLVIALWAVELPFYLFSLVSKYLFPASVAVTKGAFKLTRWSFLSLTRLFGRRGN